ncbi:GUN4 domain-containing protein [Microcoleus sp. F4-D5]|uniref:GUN4 domain-containing protein n=1 Tax=Microcoleus sp. F4-D5 TaxID=2818760 RepID=UPI002FCEF751
MGKNWAISIGINKYDFLQPLKYAKRDAELMQEFLCNQAGFEQVLLFSDDSTPDFMGRSTRPSFTNLRRVLRTMFDKPFMGDGDNFWFFFSGHGVPDNGCDYIMPVDGDPGDVANTAIPISYVTQCLRRCGADNVLLILDACRKQGTRSGEGIGKQTADIAREMGVISIFSCSPDQYSYEIETLQQGVFTSALLEGLGIQGKCATVERLNDYLRWRVPELIRQHKSEKVRQMPYTIVEPVTKYHLIILPKYATLADIAALKIDAFQAEAEKNFELAEQLWIRVLAAASGKDMSAIEAIKRIDRLQREDQASSHRGVIWGTVYQDNSVNTSVGKQAESPLSPKSQLITNITPIEPDVPLKSERGVDYTKLRDLLATGQWKEADGETLKKMLEVADRTNEKWLREEDIDRLPCEDLRTIDQLWVKYSNGRFGFSVQKRIYESLGGSRGEYDQKSWEAFGDRVGWRVNSWFLGWGVNSSWIGYNDLKFNTKAPQGHFPRWWGEGGVGLWGCLRSLLSRRDL